MATPLDPETFYSFVEGHPAAFVHFWAAWNGYDVPMKALIARLEPEYRGRVAFASLDVDQQGDGMQEIGRRHRVIGPPFYAYYREGVLRKTEVGMLTEGQLRGRLDDLLAGSPT